jgi:hypothetical protein
MSLFTSTELTPQETLENLDTLEKRYGVDDGIFRNIHYMGNQPSGSLQLHREYLTGRKAYRNRSSNNYIVAQRIHSRIRRLFRWLSFDIGRNRLGSATLYS